MTASGSAAHDGHDHRPVAADLFSIFGAPAAALARRPRRVRRPDPVEPEVVEDEVVEDEVVEDDVPDRTGRRAPVADGARPVSRPPGARVPRRRPGVVEVRDRRHVDLLLLAAATHGPASGHELVDLVRERSGEIVALSPRVVVRELHRLTNDRLMQVAGNGRVRRYALTPLGERVLATRRREWEALSQGIDGVLDAADGLGRPGRAE
jgi:DNA-binding PadR family transcriptional regulator